jgi:autotransporter-associated beta strand protein
VNNGATLDVDGQAIWGGSSSVAVTVAGAGSGGGGAIVNSGTSQTKVFHIVTMTGDTAFGGSGNWDIRNSTGTGMPSDAQLIGSFNLTKVNTNTVTLQGVALDPNLGNINVQAGTLTFTYNSSATLTTLGNAAATVTVFSNATLTLDTIGNVPSKNFVLTNGGSLHCTSTNNFGDPLTLTGAANNTINVGSGSQFTITSAITGNGSLSKNGSGPLYLEAANSYTGNTVISGGTLALYGGGANGSIASSALINLTSGATLDVSGRSDGTFTLASGQTLNGGTGTNAGTINGIFVASAGSVLAPGTGTTNTGSIDVTSNGTLQGATQMKLNATAGSNDQLAAYAITYGGTLSVTNAIGTITNDETFQLFVSSNGVYNAGSFGSVYLPTAPGLTWTNNLAVNGTITAGVVPVSPTPPIITGFNLTGTQLIISGTSSSTNTSFTYSLLTATNLLTPLANWSIVSTGNAFNPGGNFRLTNMVNQYAPQNYYLLRVP